MIHRFDIRVRTDGELEDFLDCLPKGWEVGTHGWIPRSDGFEDSWARIRIKGGSKRKAYLQLVRIKNELDLGYCRITALKSLEE